MLACAHIDACVPNFLIQECNIDFASPFIRDLFFDLPVIEQGHLLLPEKPGLGIGFNEAAAEKYPFRPCDRPVIIQPDGGIGLE